MFQPIGLVVLSGAALCAANPPLPSSNEANMIIGSLGAPGPLAPAGLYTLQNEFGGALQFGTDFPIRSIGIDDLRVVNNPKNEYDMMCCPPGTVFNGESCVFLASQICPKGFTLDPVTKSICISTTPPCPPGLNLDDGLCISTTPPKCLDINAVFDKETFECVSTTNPLCDAPLEREGHKCVYPSRCPPGFEPNGVRCVSITKPTCGSPELLVDKDSRGNPICVSKDPPACPSGAEPSKGSCVTIKPPSCPSGFRHERGSCIYDGSPCPDNAIFTEFADERSPVCRTKEDVSCPPGSEFDDGEGECVSNEPPCPPDYELDPVTKMCTRYEKLCPTGMKAFPTDDLHQHAFCCPDVPGMELDDEDHCSFPATTEECPAGMISDPDNERCIYEPDSSRCAKGEFDRTTGLCKLETEPICTVGKPIRGLCTIGRPICPPLSEFDPVSKFCRMIALPRCPPKTIQMGSECIWPDPSTCPPGTKHSADRTKCVYAAPPSCPDPRATYDSDRQLCVFPNIPECDPSLGTLVGSDCVSPALPTCIGAEAKIDPVTGKCVSIKPPNCDPGFHVPLDGDKCVSDKGPVCEGNEFTLVGDKCISDQPPDCPPDSHWIQCKKACVSKKDPCTEGTPDSNGNCVSTTPPECKIPGTHFEPGLGCRAEKDPGCDIPGTKLNRTTGNCEAEGDPQCPSGLELKGALCVSPDPPHCPPQTAPTTDGKCVAIAKPVCDGDQLSFNAERKVCVGKDPMCPDGTTLDKDKEKCITASSRTCFVLLSCPGVDDDISPPSIEG
jgi:hypothetical protein